jgi:hypothetical protein
MKLCATAERAVLLHGDFVGKNLLRSGAGYVAIDPIPRIATHARTPAPSPPAIRPRPRSCSGRSRRRAYSPGPASERSAGQPSGLSCRPVRPGVKTSPTLKPACPATSSSTCSLSNASSQILTAAMLVLPGPPKGPTSAQAPVQHLHQVSSGAQNSQICMPLPALPVDPRRFRGPDHPPGNHRRRGRSHRLPDLDRGHLHGPVHPLTRGRARAERSTGRLGPHEHVQVR